MTPDKGTSHSNEVILAVAGDASAAKTAVLNARQIGLELLIAMGSYPEYHHGGIHDFIKKIFERVCIRERPYNNQR